MKETINYFRKESQNIRFKYALGDTDILGNTFHTYYEVFLLQNGFVEYASEKNKYPLSPYDIVIIPPGSYHQFIITKKIETYERFVLEFEQSALPELDINALKFAKNQPIRLNFNSEIVHIFERLKSWFYLYSESDYSILLKTNLIELLILIQYEKNDFKNSKNINPLVVSIVEFINLHIKEKLTLESIAQALFVSKSTLWHSFEHEMHISINQYIQQKRITMAKQFLEKGQHPTEVFQECGFTDYTTFYRTYKKYFSVMPSRSLFPKTR